MLSARGYVSVYGRETRAASKGPPTAIFGNGLCQYDRSARRPSLIAREGTAPLGVSLPERSVVRLRIDQTHHPSPTTTTLSTPSDVNVRERV